MSIPTPVRRTYRPGDLAPVSGIYRVTHMGRHREPHEALVIRGEELPPCRTCKSMVIFEVVRPTSHITHEWDFAGPTVLTVKPHSRNLANVRRSRRLEVDLPITIEDERAGAIRSFSGRSNNISEGGLSATVEAVVPGDSVVRISIVLPEQQGIVVMPARLRHVHGLRHGFEFGKAARQQRTLRQALDF